MSNKRLISLILVAFIHVALGYFVISGLALKAVKLVTEPIETFEVEETVEVEDEPPPPPQELDDIPPFVPPPDIQVQNLPPPPAPVTTVDVPPPPRPAPRVVIAPPAPPAPPPAGPTREAQPRGTRSAFSTADYPAASERQREEGTTTARYRISAEGRVQKGSCEIVQSSGHRRLDTQTCRIIERRFRFEPALQNGTPVASTKTQRVRWQVPE
ncbi:MAG: energy transducer TonB [Pseudomonadota bacterium]